MNQKQYVHAFQPLTEQISNQNRDIFCAAVTGILAGRNHQTSPGPLDPNDVVAQARAVVRAAWNNDEDLLGPVFA